MSERAELEAAIAVLEPIGQNRGVENGWLWEANASIPWPDDPRVPLVKGGPDVVLQSAVWPMIEVLRAAAKAGPLALAAAVDRAPHLDAALALARAINEAAAE